MVNKVKNMKINLGIVFHFHQPVDNFNWVIEDAYNKSYKPLIDNIFKFPEVKVTLHFSGNILEWLIKNKPKTIEKIKKMANRGQIELIGGGFYEPIFAIIPHRDKISQIIKLSNLIQEKFGLKPVGAWLSERVWEPDYPSFLNECGLKYVIVDDNHFRSTGIKEIDTLYSYNTENEGKTLRVFPINEPLRYLTPWKPTTHSIEYLKSIADDKGDRIALLISDAEKMGVWGTTHQICYVDGEGHHEGDEGKPFIPTFFKRITENKWINSITLKEYMEKHPAKGLIYLPTASYDKMEEWVLPTSIRKKFESLREELRKNPQRQDEYMFLKGGFWRYFLVKYPESNNMHKKMLHVRNKLISVEKQLKEKNLIRKYKDYIIEAWDEIYKAQCNDCYWHGLFGGIYLQFLRFSVYSHLINAERIIDNISSDLYNLKAKNYIFITPMDFNKNSKTEIIIESDLINLYIDPDDGGTIFELDYKPKSYNLLNTLTRWPEAYHDKEKIESNEIHIDRYRRSMFRIRIFNVETTLEQLISDKYQEMGSFVNQSFGILKMEKDLEAAIVELKGSGSIIDKQENSLIECSVMKKITLSEKSIELNVKCELNSSQSGKQLNSYYMGIDLPFFFNGNPDDFSWHCEDINENLKENSQLIDPLSFQCSKIKVFDKTYDLKLEMEFSSKIKPDKILKFPIIAYAFTDEGYKQIFEGINIIPCFKMRDKLDVSIKLIIE